MYNNCITYVNICQLLHMLNDIFQPHGCVNSRHKQPIHFNNKTLAKFTPLVYNILTALGGELAVPCYSQSATVGLNVAGGFRRGKQASARGVDTKVLCIVRLLSVSGWGHSSTTQFERVPQGSFGVATYRDTVSASTVNCNAQSLQTQVAVEKSTTTFFDIFTYSTQKDEGV